MAEAIFRVNKTDPFFLTGNSIAEHNSLCFLEIQLLIIENSPKTSYFITLITVTGVTRMVGGKLPT